MKMIKIAKLPCIQEDTDKWGRPLGTFSVVDIQGYIDEYRWNKIQAFEGYYLSEGAKEDEAIMKKHIDNALVLGTQEAFKVGSLPTLPNMEKAFGDCKSMIYQFNLRLDSKNEDVSEYVRSFATFGEKTLYAWTPEHDEKVKFFQTKVAEMNKK
jgi:hypothetical protein